MACILKSIPGSTDFEGQAGVEITLEIKNHVGNVLIFGAEYDGKQLVPENTALGTVKLTIARDSRTLKLVFVFTASTMGRGELRESSGADSQFMRALVGHEPFQAIRIVGLP